MDAAFLTCKESNRSHSSSHAAQLGFWLHTSLLLALYHPAHEQQPHWPLLHRQIVHGCAWGHRSRCPFTMWPPLFSPQSEESNNNEANELCPEHLLHYHSSLRATLQSNESRLTTKRDKPFLTLFLTCFESISLSLCSRATTSMHCSKLQGDSHLPNRSLAEESRFWKPIYLVLCYSALKPD